MNIVYILFLLAIYRVQCDWLFSAGCSEPQRGSSVNGNCVFLAYPTEYYRLIVCDNEVAKTYHCSNPQCDPESCTLKETSELDKCGEDNIVHYCSKNETDYTKYVGKNYWIYGSGVFGTQCTVAERTRANVLDECMPAYDDMPYKKSMMYHCDISFVQKNLYDDDNCTVLAFQTVKKILRCDPYDGYIYCSKRFAA